MTTQQFTIAQFLDETNREARESLRANALQLLGWKQYCAGSSDWISPEEIEDLPTPPLDHNLAAKVRETLTEEERNDYSQCLCDILLSTDRVALLFSSPTQQIVAALIAKGIIK